MICWQLNDTCQRKDALFLWLAGMVQGVSTGKACLLEQLISRQACQMLIGHFRLQNTIRRWVTLCITVVDYNDSTFCDGKWSWNRMVCGYVPASHAKDLRFETNWIVWKLHMLTSDLTLIVGNTTLSWFGVHIKLLFLLPTNFDCNPTFEVTKSISHHQNVYRMISRGVSHKCSSKKLVYVNENCWNYRQSIRHWNYSSRQKIWSYVSIFVLFISYVCALHF